jgi:hypothetical protein
VKHFPALGRSKTHISLNGELAYEVHASHGFGAQVQHQCTPRWLFFLERTDEPGISLTPLDRDHARQYIAENVERMPEQMGDAIGRRAHAMNVVAELPCWSLRYGGTPAFAALHLREFVAGLRRECA